MFRALFQRRNITSQKRAPTPRYLAFAAACAIAFGAAGNAVRAQSTASSGPAGRLPDHLHVVISGDPASPDFVAGQVTAAVVQAIGSTLTPGSSIGPPVISPAPQALGRGFLTSFHVAMTIAPGPDAEAVSASTIVDVENAGLAGFAPVLLGFRDDPERIVGDGVLSRTTVDTAHATRVYYYHQNIRVRRRFCVVLSVNDSVRTRVQIVGAAAGPNLDVMSVGHAVSKTFLTRQPHAEGLVIGIAGGKPYIERDTPVDPGDGIVGSLDVRVLSGGPLTVTVMAIPSGAEPAAYLYTAKLPDDGHARRGLFNLGGFAQTVVAYTAGGRDVAYVYGTRQKTLTNLDPADPGHDYGDYGVIQQLTFDLDNPTGAPVTLFVYEKPLGGVVRSSFVVDGTLVDLGCVRVAQRYAVSRYELEAHAAAALSVLTMTDGGSNYPLEIGLTATPPITVTPGISAADGCFPKPPAARPK